MGILILKKGSRPTDFSEDFKRSQRIVSPTKCLIGVAEQTRVEGPFVLQRGRTSYPLLRFWGGKDIPLPCPPKLSRRLFFRLRQQSNNPAQTVPCCLTQRRLRAHEVADHVPRRHIQRALRRHSHCQRHGALRTKAYPVCRRLLPRTHSHRLRKHIHRDRFVSGLNSSPAS